MWAKNDLVVPLKRHAYGHPLAGLLWEHKLDEVCFQEGLRDEFGAVCFLIQIKDRSESGWLSQTHCAMWETVKQAEEGVESDGC